MQFLDLSGSTPTSHNLSKFLTDWQIQQPAHNLNIHWPMKLAEGAVERLKICSLAHSVQGRQTLQRGVHNVKNLKGMMQWYTRGCEEYHRTYSENYNHIFTKDFKDVKHCIRITHGKHLCFCFFRRGEVGSSFLLWQENQIRNQVIYRYELHNTQVRGFQHCQASARLVITAEQCYKFTNCVFPVSK